MPRKKKKPAPSSFAKTLNIVQRIQASEHPQTLPKAPHAEGAEADPNGTENGLDESDPVIYGNVCDDFPTAREAFEGEPVHKYWSQRSRLFTRFDEGIVLDKESMFSVMPESIAQHVALRIQSIVIKGAEATSCEMNGDTDFTVIDGFCGAGGCTIQLANICDRGVCFSIPERHDACHSKY